MSKSAFSVMVYGILLILMGLGFLIFPDICLSILRMKAAEEVWIHIAGWCIFWIGVYYTVAARNDLKAFILWTTYSRPTLIVFLTILVILDMIEPIVIAIGAIELIAAIWTIMALRSEKLGGATRG